MKRLRRLRREAGKVRDLDVQIAALNAIKIGSIARDKSRLLADLGRARQKREAKLAVSVKAECDEALRKQLKRIERKIETSSSDGGKDYGTIALERFAEVSQRYSTLTEENLHEFRIACKQVRYMAEMSGTATAGTVVSSCKRIQDAIGQWHDFVMLAKRAARLFSCTPVSPLISVLRTLQNAKFAEALRTNVEVRTTLLAIRVPYPGRAAKTTDTELHSLAAASYRAA